jgi:uncharacterized protein YydD (DUF2326 family)
LIAFNKAITDERHVYLQEERAEIEAELKRVGTELNALGKRRSEMLAFLSGTDAFGKSDAESDARKTQGAGIEGVRLGLVQKFRRCLAFSAYWADREHGTDPRIVR